MYMKEIVRAIFLFEELIKAAQAAGLYEFIVTFNGKEARVIVRRDEAGTIKVESTEYRSITFTRDGLQDAMVNFDLLWKTAEYASKFLQDKEKIYEEARKILSPFALDHKLNGGN